MIIEPGRYNRFGTACEYVLKDSPKLHRFENNTFDFICATTVLQHMPADVGKGYISESGPICTIAAPSVIAVAKHELADA